MSLGNKLRHAEEYGSKAAHLGAERVRNGIHNAEAALHKLAVSRKRKPSKPASVRPDPAQEAGSAPSPKIRTGIVSVNGRDVGEMHCTGGRH